jgi:exodeoxyribonuclease-3
MRIATWNVNSLKARLKKVMWWLDRAKPDVLLMQETKLADGDAPIEAFKLAGYELTHHGEGRWNGVAIASRCGIGGVITNFGEPLPAARTSETGDDEPLAEARMISAECGGLRVICIHKNVGMRIDHLLVTASLQPRMVWSEIDREARNGKPLPSDHTPVVIDLDKAGHPFDAGWASAESRIAARLRKQ